MVNRKGRERLGYGEGDAETAPFIREKEEAARAERAFVRAEAEAGSRLPDSYGVDRVVVMVRDPYWIHTYWELTEETLSRAMSRLGKAAKGARVILRVCCREAEGGGPERILFDITPALHSRNWYISVGGPSRTYWVDVGLLTLDGRFLRLMRSNLVATPSDRMSDELDEQWRSLASEYEEMYALSGGFSRGASSLELHRRLARRLELGQASLPFSPEHWRDPGPRHRKEDR
ncbi:MAG: DUF4912 domain-containing protein [Candidatus Eiseniibacteriota bacterium]|nr:MAG: DUF4912 domain-containing protein [Candidatus Eisenbacteria bacterium]